MLPLAPRAPQRKATTARVECSRAPRPTFMARTATIAYRNRQAISRLEEIADTWAFRGKACGASALPFVPPFLRERRQCPPLGTRWQTGCVGVAGTFPSAAAAVQRHPAQLLIAASADEDGQRMAMPVAGRRNASRCARLPAPCRGQPVMLRVLQASGARAVPSAIEDARRARDVALLPTRRRALVAICESVAASAGACARKLRSVALENGFSDGAESGPPLFPTVQPQNCG